ncbi:MAG: hypothetical protein IM618_11105 [Cytophagales bacterium]|nr:hypothetical protein [Cytophagales bacterium]
MSLTMVVPNSESEVCGVVYVSVEGSRNNPLNTVRKSKYELDRALFKYIPCETDRQVIYDLIASEFQQRKAEKEIGRLN